jgi:hypothetical protein
LFTKNNTLKLRSPLKGHKRSNSKIVITKSNIRLKTPVVGLKKPKHMKSKSIAKSTITSNYKGISKTARIKTKKKHKDLYKYTPVDKKRKILTKTNNYMSKKK